MVKRSKVDQLNDWIDRIISNPEATPEAGLAPEPLLETARALRDLPSETFRFRLKAELETRAGIQKEKIMTTKTEQRYSTVTPYIVVQEAPELVEFMKKAFGAEELFRATGSAGGFHIEVQIGNSLLMVGGGGAWKGTPMPTSLHLYVPDADAVYKQALEAGAQSMMEPVDQFYGDREGTVIDPSGNRWYIATHQEGHYIPEGLRSVTLTLHPKGGSKLIDFMKKAFDAEQIGRHDAPDGTVAHATMKIGNSYIEIGEAHGPITSMPTTIYFSVDNVESYYRKALDAGAVSFQQPTKQDYGAMVAGVSDEFGNKWYIASHS